MNFLIDAFHTVLYNPLLNALVLLYEYIPGRDFGIAVIVLTLIIRFSLYPLMMKSIRSQKIMAELQPKLKEIQEKYKDDKEKQTKEMMELYKREKFNPLGGCLPTLIQLPILLALYRVFWHGMSNGAMSNLYSFVPNPGTINPMFLGILDLSTPNFIVAILAGIAQFFQTKTMSATNSVPSDGKNQFSNMLQKQMLYIFPFFTVVILLKLPAAIGLYWIVTALFSVWQQRLVFKKNEQRTA